MRDDSRAYHSEQERGDVHPPQGNQAGVASQAQSSGRLQHDGSPTPRYLSRRWLTGLAAAWAVLILVLAIIARDGDVTVQTQRNAAEVRPSVDRAVADIVTAAGPEVALTVSPYRFDGSCRISLVRRGVFYERLLRLYTPPGEEQALLERIVDRLPDRYATRLRTGEEQLHVFADADELVTVGGDTWPGSGRIEFSIHTGCRPVEQPIVTFYPRPDPEVRARLDDLLAAADGTVAAWRTAAVPCPDGLRWALEVTAEQRFDSLTGFAESRPEGATVVISEDDLLVYQDGPYSITVSLREGTLTATATPRCDG